MVEEVVCRRMLVPDGNCRHCPESRSVVYQNHVSIRNDHIVGELVLHDHLNHYLRMNFVPWFTRSPCENLIQSLVTRYLR